MCQFYLSDLTRFVWFVSSLSLSLSVWLASPSRSFTSKAVCNILDILESNDLPTVIYWRPRRHKLQLLGRGVKERDCLNFNCNRTTDHPILRRVVLMLDSKVVSIYKDDNERLLFLTIVVVIICCCLRIDTSAHQSVFFVVLWLMCSFLNEIRDWLSLMLPCVLTWLTKGKFIERNYKFRAKSIIFPTSVSF